MWSTNIGQEYFRDKVGNLLEICLQVLEEFYIEDLIETLNEIVFRFNEEAIPYSLQVCEKLSEAYKDIMIQLGQDDGDIANAKNANTANGCINAIFRLISSIGTQGSVKDKEIIHQIEGEVHDILVNSLEKDFIDVHESVMTCIGAISYYSSEITSNLWQIFPKLIELVNHYLDPETSDYGFISPGVMAMMNYMQKDPNTFISIQMESGQTPFEAVVNIIQKTIEISHEWEDLILHKTGTELVIGLLENLHGKIDDSIGSILELMVNEISDNIDKCGKKLIVQSICMSFAYNWSLTFKILEEKNWTQGVFQVIFDTLEDIKYDFEIQRVVLGLLAVVSCTDCQLPEIVVQGMPQLFKEILRLCQKSVYTREQRNKSPDEKYEQKYEQAINILDDWSDEEEYDEDEEYDPEDSKHENEELYKSFTQEVDEVQQVKKALETIHPDLYDLYFGKVSREDQNAMQDCFNNPLVVK